MARLKVASRIVTIVAGGALILVGFLPLVAVAASPNWITSRISVSDSGLADEPRCDEQVVDYISVEYPNMQTRGCVLEGQAYDALYGRVPGSNSSVRQVYGLRFHDGPTDTFTSLLIQQDTTIAFLKASSGLVEATSHDNGSQTIYTYGDVLHQFDVSQVDEDGVPMEFSLTRNAEGVHSYQIDSQLTLPLSFASSNDGRYIASTYAKDGYTVVVKLDTTTGELFQYSLEDVSEFWYVDVNAISNDGRYFFMSANDQALIYDTTSCHISAGAIHSACDSRDVDPDIESLAGRADTPYAVSFSDDGLTLHASVLRFLNDGDAGELYSVYLSIDTRFEYLALGDSFSSGEGDLSKHEEGDSNYRYGTDVKGDASKGIPREMCHVSERAYPSLLANGMNLGESVTDGTQRWGTVACSGAQISDIKESTGGYLGQSNMLAGLSNIVQLQTEALTDMVPGRIPQIEFVRKYRPRVVTLTIGGNDAQFKNTILACVSPDIAHGGELAQTCSYGKDDSSKARIGSTILGLRNDFVSLYKKLKNAYGSSTKLYVLGYPLIVDDKTTKTNDASANIAACGWNVRLNYDERKMVVASTKFLNSVIRSAADEAGAIYIDTEDAFATHKLCGSSPLKAVNGITGLANNSESFHPNPYGHSLLARRVWDATNGKTLSDYTCQDSQYVTCPSGSADPIIVPDYFKEAMRSNPPSTADGSVAPDILKLGSLFLLLSPTTASAFVANSAYTVLLYSNPTNLGTYTTDSYGNFSQNIELPDSVPPGYHTLEIRGTGLDGKPLTIWKIVEVRSQNDDDYDGDGIPNDQDQCQYIQPVGVDKDEDGIDDGCDPEITQIGNTGTQKAKSGTKDIASANPSTYTAKSESPIDADGHSKELDNAHTGDNAPHQVSTRNEGYNTNWQNVAMTGLIIAVPIIVSGILILWHKKR